MKYSIIEEIYNGRRGLGETIKLSEEGAKISDECISLYDSLRSTLNDEQKELLEKLIEKDLESEAETALTNYKEGLKVGLLLLSECLHD